MVFGSKTISLERLFPSMFYGNWFCISELFGEEVTKEVKLFPITKEHLETKISDFEAKVGEIIINLSNIGLFKLIKEV